jgi:hypothetical protein
MEKVGILLINLQALAITEIKVTEYRYNYLTKKVFFLLQLH